MKKKENISGHVLSQKDLCELIKGSKLHRRITQRPVTVEYDSHNSDDEDEDEEDPDFNPIEEESEFTDYDDDNTSENEGEGDGQLNLSTVSIGSTGSSCIKNILTELKKLNNKHNWKNETIDGLIVKYFKSKNAMSKLFMYKIDIINGKVNEHFGIYLFQKKDSKTVRMTKMYAQLKRMPQLLNYESSSDNMETVFQPKALKQIYLDFILGAKYPKEYLAAPICCIGHLEKVVEWEYKSPVPITLTLPNSQGNHIV